MVDYSIWFKNNDSMVLKPILGIEKVIYNKPATIVKWGDGTKTVVKCQSGDNFDPEKGLAMAIVKKLLGNTGNYNEQLKKWLPKDDSKEEQTKVDPKKTVIKEKSNKKKNTVDVNINTGDINRELIKALLGLPF